jgi:hypothetical protein
VGYKLWLSGTSDFHRSPSSQDTLSAGISEA